MDESIVRLLNDVRERRGPYKYPSRNTPLYRTPGRRITRKQPAKKQPAAPGYRSRAEYAVMSGRRRKLPSRKQPQVPGYLSPGQYDRLLGGAANAAAAAAAANRTNRGASPGPVLRRTLSNSTASTASTASTVSVNRAGPSRRSANRAGPSGRQSGSPSASIINLTMNSNDNTPPPRQPKRRRTQPNRPAELPLARPDGARLNAAVSNAVNANGIQTRFSNVAIKPHQKNACLLFVKPRTKGLLLYHRVGSGKTLTAIACVENLARREGRRRLAIVVVPASLQDNFRKEIDKAGVNPANYRIMSLEGVHGMRTAAERVALGRDNVVVIDEAQNLRNPLSKRLDSILELCSQAHKRLLLSGTPVMNYPADIGPLLGLIDPANVPTAVKERVRNKAGDGWTWSARFNKNFGRNAERNAAALDAMLRCTSLFYEPDAATVAASYPGKRERWVTVNMTDEQTMQQFRLALEEPGAFDIQAVLDGTSSIAFLTRPRNINTRLKLVDGRTKEVLLEHKPKIDAVVAAVAQTVAAGGKCVVFSSYVEDGLHVIYEMLRARNVPVGLYDGKTKQTDKKAIVQKYNGGDLKVILLSDAGKEGLDLKETKEVHILEPAWNEEKIAQVIGRAIRYKSHAFDPSRGPRPVVDVLRYYSTLSPDYKQLRSRFAGYDERAHSILFDYSADEVLKLRAQDKQRVNQAFLDRLVRISDDNLRTCLQ